MLVGEPPFSGPTAQAIVAKVMTEEPRPLTPRRRSMPAEVEEAVFTALEKLPADRFGSAARVRGEPDRRADGRRTGARARATATAASPWRRWIPLAAGGAALLVAGYLLGARRSHSGALPMTFGSRVKVTWDPGMEVLPAISPDGKTVAYAGGTSARMRVYVRPVAGGRGIALTDDTTQVQSHPRWSPDGSRVLFLERDGVVSVPATGGAETAEVPPGRTGPVSSAAWAPDGRRIAYVVGDSVFVREPGGEVHGIARVYAAHGCAWSPDAEYLACSSGNAIALTPGLLFGNASPSRVVSVRVRDGGIVPLTDSLSANLARPGRPTAAGSTTSPTALGRATSSRRRSPEESRMVRPFGSRPASTPTPSPSRRTDGGSHTAISRSRATPGPSPCRRTRRRRPRAPSRSPVGPSSSSRACSPPTAAGCTTTPT